MRCTKRTFLVGIAAWIAAVAPSLSRPIHGGAASGTPPASGLQISITFPSDSPYVANGFAPSVGPFTFTFASATRLTGDFVGPSFTQQNWLATNASLPGIYVFFRPDASGGRREIVVWNGHCWTNSIAQNISTGIISGKAYSVSIDDSGGNLYSTDITNDHGWQSRWRWQSSERPIVNTPTDIVNNNWWPKYDTTGLPALEAYDASHYQYVPLGNSGIDESMGSTGDRPDIGMAAEPLARWMLSPSASSGGKTYESAMRAWAEAGNSIPIHTWDETAKAPIDLFVYPRANSNTQHGDNLPYIYARGGQSAFATITGSVTGNILTVTAITGAPIGAGLGIWSATYNTGSNIVSQISGTTGGTGTYQLQDSLTLPSGSVEVYKKIAWNADTAHYPHLRYIPFLATFDPYHLEGSQFDCIQSFMTSAYLNNFATYGTPLCQISGGAREYFWDWRNILMAWKATLVTENLYGALPSWILPSTGFYKMIQGNYQYFYDSWMTATSPNPNPCTIWNSSIRMGNTSLWEMDFGTQAMPLGILFSAPASLTSGITATQVSDYCLGQTLARTNGTSGWPVAYPTPYYTNQDTQGANIGLPTDISGYPGDAYYSTPAEIFAGYEGENLSVFQGSISGATLTVSSTTGRSIGGNGYPCEVNTAAGLVAGTQITGQLSGTTGGVGTYSVNNSQTVSGPITMVAQSGGEMTVTTYWALAADQFNGGVWAEVGAGPDFLLYTRSALAIAKRLGRPNTATPFGYVTTMVNQPSYNYMTARQAFASS